MKIEEGTDFTLRINSYVSAFKDMYLNSLSVKKVQIETFYLLNKDGSFMSLLPLDQTPYRMFAPRIVSALDHFDRSKKQIVEGCLRILDTHVLYCSDCQEVWILCWVGFGLYPGQGVRISVYLYCSDASFCSVYDGYLFGTLTLDAEMKNKIFAQTLEHHTCLSKDKKNEMLEKK